MKWSRNPVLLAAVRRSVVRAIEAALRRSCPDAPRAARCGTVSFVQRFGSVQRRIRSRVLRLAVRHGAFTAEVAADLARWGHGGGFSLHAAVRIEAADRAGLERLLRYCARPAFASERLTWDGPGQPVRYALAKPLPSGQTELTLTPLELLDRLAALVPPPRAGAPRFPGRDCWHASTRSAR